MSRARMAELKGRRERNRARQALRKATEKAGNWLTEHKKGIPIMDQVMNLIILLFLLVNAT